MIFKFAHWIVQSLTNPRALIKVSHKMADPSEVTHPYHDKICESVVGIQIPLQNVILTSLPSNKYEYPKLIILLGGSQMRKLFFVFHRWLSM